jgi:CheY-like chemotaxis protein
VFGRAWFTYRCDVLREELLVSDAIRILSLGFSSSELHMMQIVLDSAARTLPRGFRLVKASEVADVAVVNWSTLNIERTQGFLGERFPGIQLISVSETGVLGSPGMCVAEAQLLPNLAAMVYEAIEGVEETARARPPEYVSWLSMRRHEPAPASPVVTPAPAAEPAAAPRPQAHAPVFAAPPLIDAPASEPQLLFGIRVLMVDVRSDGIDIGRQLLHGLGARVDLAHDDHDAWTRHQHEHYDAVLIDARIADEAGFKLCRRIAHDSVRKPPPVFMLAEKLRPIERARGAHAGSAGFLTWPLKLEALLAALGPLRATAAAG